MVPGLPWSNSPFFLLANAGSLPHGVRPMKRAVITGLGFITSIGNSKAEVLDNLRAGRHGIELYPPFDHPDIPPKLLGTIKDFDFPTADFEDWTYPAEYRLRRELMRPMTPNALCGYAAMKQAIEDAKLSSEEVEDPRACFIGASGGSPMMTHENNLVLDRRGVMRCPPMAMVNSITGSLYINIVNVFRIHGGALQTASACASTAHSLGFALDHIRLGRRDRIFVVGAEDALLRTILPFAGIRALSVQTDPNKAPRAFDKARDGFVGTGGAVALVVESLEAAEKRGATPYVELKGWAESSDGYDVFAPEPDGKGLARAIRDAFTDAGVQPESIDYINAHATATPPGDAAEIAALRQVFPEGGIPKISSTKSLTGHGLSMAGAMESAFCCLAIQEGFTPISAKITELDPICEGVPVVKEPIDFAPKRVLKNSSGFGGANVALVFDQFDS